MGGRRRRPGFEIYRPVSAALSVKEEHCSFVIVHLSFVIARKPVGQCPMNIERFIRDDK
jgi:hypothetical protein